MVTGATEGIRHNPHTMTITQEEIPYCSPNTTSGKQKKARFTSQPQFRSENTPATIEADQILLALQQLATNSNSANFNNNIGNLEIAKIYHNGDAYARRKIREIWTVWRSVPNEFENLQSVDGRRQNELLPLSNAWWCSTDFQKQH